MKQFERAELKSLSTLKLNNPNKFNAINSVFAFLVAIVGFEIITSFISPFLKALTSELGIGVALCLSIIISQVFVFLVALAFCKLKNVSLFGSGEINLRFNFAPCIPALLLSVGTMLLISPSHNYFAERIADFLKIKVHQMDDPAHSVVKGAAVAIKKSELLKNVDYQLRSIKELTIE